MATPANDRTTAPSPQPLPKPQTTRPLATTPLRSFGVRLLLALSGLGLFVGFFMPWAVLGDEVGGSGFDLLVGGSELVDLLIAPARPVLLLIPVLGAMLLVGAWTGHRAALWVSLASGITVIGYGIYALLSLFLRVTGLGMWIVVASAFVALFLGLLSLGRAAAPPQS